ncbi:hypothetical protein BH09SUM1_BH09SUM1_23460 [soil metagenome]
MAFEVALFRGASAEVEQAVQYFQGRDKETAAKFAEEIREFIHEVAYTPYRWPIVRDKYRRYPMTSVKYLIYYFVEGEKVTIAAVASSKRKPFYWSKRRR